MNILQNQQISSYAKRDTYIFNFCTFWWKPCYLPEKRMQWKEFLFPKAVIFIIFFVLPSRFFCTLHNFPFIIESFKWTLVMKVVLLDFEFSSFLFHWLTARWQWCKKVTLWETNVAPLHDSVPLPVKWVRLLLSTLHCLYRAPLKM